MTLQLSSEIDIVKKVVDATLEQLEEHEDKYTNKMIAMDSRFETLNELIDKKVNKINKD